jgi:hypothetical protein
MSLYHCVLGDANDVTGTAVSCEVVELVLETVVFAEPLELPPMQWSLLLDPLIQKFVGEVIFIFVLL